MLQKETRGNLTMHVGRSREGGVKRLPWVVIGLNLICDSKHFGLKFWG